MIKRVYNTVDCVENVCCSLLSNLTSQATTTALNLKCECIIRDNYNKLVSIHTGVKHSIKNLNRSLDNFKYDDKEVVEEYIKLMTIVYKIIAIFIKYEQGKTEPLRKHVSKLSEIVKIIKKEITYKNEMVELIEGSLLDGEFD